MKLKKNVALVMVAAAMLAGGYAQADNPPPTPQGDTIKNPTGARAATAIKENISKDGQRGGIFSKKDKKGEKDDSRGYKEAWAQQGCTKEAWVELNNQYDKSINMSVDQSAVTDQKIMDVIQNPNQMNITGFEMLGCNLNSSLDELRTIAEAAQGIFLAISRGNIKDKMLTQLLEKQARQMLNRVINRVKEKACQVLDKQVDSLNNAMKPYLQNAADISSQVDEALKGLDGGGGNSKE